MNKLYLDTSAGELSLAIKKDDKEVYEYSYQIRNKMAEEIIPLIIKASKENGLEFSSYDEIFVTTGPGSYTGERISLTVAKIYALLKKGSKVFLASTLKIMTSLISDKPCLALLDARNEAYFAGAYENGKCLLEDQRAEKNVVDDFLVKNPSSVLICDSSFKDEVEKRFPSKEVLSLNMPKSLTNNEGFYTEAEDPLKIKPTYLRGI